MVVHIQQLNQNYITVLQTRISVPFISLTIILVHQKVTITVKCYQPKLIVYLLLLITLYNLCNILNTADLKF